MNRTDRRYIADQIARMKTSDYVWDHSGLSSITPDTLWEALPEGIRERVDIQDFADIYEVWFILSQEHFKKRKMDREAQAVNIRLHEFVLAEKEKELEEKLGLSPRLQREAAKIRRDISLMDTLEGEDGEPDSKTGDPKKSED